MRDEPEVGMLPRRRGNGAPGAAPGVLEEPPREPFPLGRVLDDEGRATRDVGLSDDALVAAYRRMVLSRILDERMIAMQRQGRIGFYIGAIGEEAAVHGSVAAMAPADWIFPSYREHGAALARGLPLVAFVCDLLGNAGDLVLGHQMPCHESWRPGCFASISSPIGTQLPHAVGAAWAARLRGDDMVALAYLGDGTTSSNDFHAALNFAGVHKVPVVFACRNNGWAISVPRAQQTASATLAQKAIAYGIRGERVDGNDLLAVYEATARARARAADGDGPTLLELETYRLEGHSTSDDPRAYRPPAEVEAWRRRDPILRLARLLRGRGLLTEAGDAALQAEARAEVQRAVQEAERHAPKPAVETLFQGVYAEPLWQQREQLDELRRALADDPRVGDARGERR